MTQATTNAFSAHTRIAGNWSSGAGTKDTSITSKHRSEDHAGGRGLAGFSPNNRESIQVMMLSSDEIKALTGYTRSSAQIRWLRRNGWRFVVNALGQPIVATAEFDRHLVGGRKAAPRQDVNLEGIND
jgi:Domain of unknown function (DUF4224)